LYEYDGADLELEQIYFRSQEPSIIIVGSLYLIPRALTLWSAPASSRLLGIVFVATSLCFSIQNIIISSSKKF
jgi:hypothetical protein